MSNNMYDSMNESMNEQPGKPMSPFSKAIKIVTAPSQAAAAIRQKPDVLLPIVVMVVLALLPVLGNYQAYLDALVQTLAVNPNSASMTADQLRELAQISAITGHRLFPGVGRGWLVAWQPDPFWVCSHARRGMPLQAAALSQRVYHGFRIAGSAGDRRGLPAFRRRVHATKLHVADIRVP